MTPDEFRAFALALEGSSEGAHHGTADFRANGRIFATLGWPDDGWAVLLLTPDERDLRMEASPEVFSPVHGRWGDHGHTRVRLAAACATEVTGALAVSWRIQMDKPKARPRKPPAG